MVHIISRFRTPLDGFPRQRGDGPEWYKWPEDPDLVPPPARGWSRRVVSFPHPPLGSPASAGMVPTIASIAGGCSGFPRQRGDGPFSEIRRLWALSVPPPARGWSLGERRLRVLAIGSPASAGMVPPTHAAAPAAARFPRQRGDGPCSGTVRVTSLRVPPPARGWSLVCDGRRKSRTGSPASAGMVPCSEQAAQTVSWFPRQRGDGPRLFNVRRPRFRVPPPARGWSATTFYPVKAKAGSPASAGMVPRQGRPERRRPRFPRQRGDGPADDVVVEMLHMVPPPARGWSRGDVRQAQCADGSPASAGMVPAISAGARRRTRFPRQRGDGPDRRAAMLSSRQVPPPARGWSHAR